MSKENRAEKLAGELHAVLNRTKGAIRVTAYITPTQIVRLTRSRKGRTQTFLLTVGSPNYRERQFIKVCKKAGETFPVKKLQIQRYPKKRKK